MEQDFKEAFKHYKLACDGGHASGCYNMGVFYSKGQGVEQDHKKAAKYYKISCDGGNIEGCFLTLEFYTTMPKVQIKTITRQKSILARLVI